MTTEIAPYAPAAPKACWSSSMPLRVGIAMRPDESPAFALNRCTVSIDDEGGGPFLVVEFFNDRFNDSGIDSPHAGYFESHADIDAFADQLHRILKAAEEAPR